MRRVIFLIVVLTFPTLAGLGQVSGLEGKWVAVSPSTRGLTRVIITPEADGSSVEAWGRCHPSDCELGKTFLSRVGKHVDDRSFKSGYAIWEPGFASKYMLLTVDRKMLRIETVTIFRDRSRRSSYKTVEYLRRVAPDLEQ